MPQPTPKSPPAFASESMQAFYQSFAVTLLWAHTDEQDGHLDDRYTPAHFTEQTAAGLRAECDRFVQANLVDLTAVSGVKGYSWELAGHDFALSRNGHGAGYFDRDLGEAGARLQAASEAFGRAEAYVGDDGLIDVCGLETFGQPPIPKPARPRGP